MKRNIRIIFLSIVLILISTLTVNAAEATATLSLDKTTIKNGDTFTVTLKVACEEGINGLQGNVDYDEEILELQSIDVGDTNWSNLGENSEIAIIHAKSGTITSADILKISFKVKDTAEVGAKAKITVSDIVLDSDAATNSTKEIGAKEIEVTITEEPAQESVTLTGIRIKNGPQKDKYKVGEKFDKTGLVIVAEYSDGTTKEVTNYTYAPAGELKLTDNKITVTYTEDNVTKSVAIGILVEADALDDNQPDDNQPEGNQPEDNKPDDNKPDDNKPSDKKEETTKQPDDTQANKPIVNAGTEHYGIIMMVLITVIAIISYKKYNQYKNI